jgi:hypothetical protein
MERISLREIRDAEKVNHAIKAFNGDDIAQARHLLREVVENAPGEYVYERREKKGTDLFLILPGSLCLKTRGTALQFG